MDSELLAAGIGPGDPSLYPVPELDGAGHDHNHPHHDHDHHDHDHHDHAHAGHHHDHHDHG